MSKDLNVIGLTKKMLRDAVEQNTYWKKGLAPMPKSKAIWVVSNSRIKDDDYCGVLAFENEKIISFISLMPDFLNIQNDNIKKVYWMISWWIHPEYKNTIIGTYTFSEALRLSNNQIIIKSYAENIAPFYKKQPLLVIASRLRHTIFLSLDPSMLIGKFKFLKPFNFILNGLDYIFSSILNSFNYSKLKKTTKTLSYEYINELDNEAWEFIKPLCKNDLILKTKEYVSWQIDNNQYTQLPTGIKQRYSSIEIGTSNNIHIYNLKIFNENKIIGFLSYIINYNEFNIKYFLVEKNENYNLCIDALIANFIKKKAKYIFTDDTKLAENITKRFTTVFTHKVTKKGLIHNKVELNKDSLNLLNRDGHFY